MARANVMPIGSVYRCKLAVEGSQRRAKCRAVIQGFKDPHLHLLLRDPPVLPRLGFHLIFPLAVSWDWMLSSSDCSSAFLRGSAASERSEMIFRRLQGRHRR